MPNLAVVKMAESFIRARKRMRHLHVADWLGESRTRFRPPSRLNTSMSDGPFSLSFRVQLKSVAVEA